MQIVVDGLLVNYQRQGSGPVVFVIPGWGDTAQSWTDIQKQLSTSYDVIVINLPGFGGSQAPVVALDLDDFASIISKFLQKLNIKHIQAIIGHSNGGAIAIKGLAVGALHTDKLILVASAGIRNKSSSKRLVYKVIAKTGKVLLFPLPASMKERARTKLYGSIGSDMLVVEHMKDTFKKVINHDIRTDASTVTIPTQLIYGSLDQETPIEFGKIFHSLIQGSRLEIIDGADHFLHVKSPDRVAGIIKDFLR